MATAAERAQQSLGTSDAAIYEMVARNVRRCHGAGGVLVDVGCGTGNLWRFVSDRFERYVGVDVVSYPGFPPDGEFHQAELDADESPIPGDHAEVVAAVETIEHLENPRKFVRELVRVAKPGGWVILSTPNQLSLLSLLTLATKHRFNAFQDVHYPTHISALLEVDLRRIAAECGLVQIAIDFGSRSRIPLTGLHYPRTMQRMLPRALSDNVLLAGKKPDR